MKAILYTSERCKFCNDVEEFLKKEKPMLDIVRKKVDVPSNAKDLFTRAGRVGIPTMIVEDEVLVGSDTIVDWITANIKRSK